MRRSLPRLAGAVLILAGLLASPVPTVMLPLAAWELATRHDLDMRADEALGLILFTAVTVGGFVWGPKLVRRNLRLGLFLRRFGFAAATEALTFAIATAVGRTWRLVTLDDMQVAPLGVAPRTRRLLRALAWTGLSVILLAVVWIFGGGLDRYITRAIEESLPKHPTDFKELIGGLFGAFIVGIFVGAIVLALITVLIAFFGATMTFSWASLAAARGSERHKAAEIRTAREVETTTESVRLRSRRILAARLVVLRVAPEVWRMAVRHLAAVASVIIIDVSEPTESLLWEIATLKPGGPRRWILVGRLDRLAHLSGAAHGPEPRAGLRERLGSLLDGEEVLAYESTSPGDMKRFAATLRAWLESVDGANPSPGDLKPRPPPS